MRRLLYAAIRAFSAVNHFLKERLTAAGWTVSGAAALAAVAGVDTHQTLAYQAFAFLGALLAVAFAGAARLKSRVTAERTLPRYVTAGEPCLYEVKLRNASGWPLRGAALKEAFKDPRPSYAEWRAAREPGEQRRNWFDREAGYFRWRWLIERRLPGPAAAVELPELAAGGCASLKLSLAARRRGRIALDGLAVVRSEPLGLVRRPSRVPLPASVIALPRRYRVPALALPGRRKFQQGGVSLASSIGDSEELVGLREYRAGDPLQRIHWKSFARAGRPIVKEFQDEFYERHALILDTSSAPGGEESLEEAVSVAASFACAIDTLESLLDLLFVGGEVRCYTAGRGQMQVDRMLEVLAGVEASGAHAFDALARAVLARAASLSSCLVVLVGWDECRRRFVESLLALGLEARAMLVCAPEHRPERAPGWLLCLHPGQIEPGLARLA